LCHTARHLNSFLVASLLGIGGKPVRQLRLCVPTGSGFALSNKSVAEMSREIFSLPSRTQLPGAVGKQL
jgi:hypothetical protein